MGPCEGRQASPSNPTGAGKARAKEPLTETFVFRCTATKKTETRRRKPVPRIDPALVLAVGRIGGNLNQIAHWLNRAMLVGRADLDSLTVAHRLLVIERQLAQIREEARRC